MDMNPQRVRTAQFKTVKRGLDPDEVQSFLASVADELERAQNQSAAMEARARAAVARLQELSNVAASQSDVSSETIQSATSQETSLSGGPGAAEAAVEATVDQSETISRTLLLAQRTADTAIAEARIEARRLRDEAEAEVAGAVESSRAAAEALLAEARAAARKASEDEKVEVAGEVNSLMARRDFLESDVDHMEQFLVAQRSRLRDAANEIIELTERVPSGLGEARRPLLSAATDGITGAAAPAAAADDATQAMMINPLAANDDLWLPDDVADTSAATDNDQAWTAPADKGDAVSGSTMRFGLDLDND